jgi:hypothetical protein
MNDREVFIVKGTPDLRPFWVLIDSSKLLIAKIYNDGPIQKWMGDIVLKHYGIPPGLWRATFMQDGGNGHVSVWKAPNKKVIAILDIDKGVLTDELRSKIQELVTGGEAFNGRNSS